MSASFKRVYFSSPDVHYILPSDALEKQRLELLHALVRRALCDGKTVLAPIVLKPGDRVLDSGTGPGAWVLSLAEEVPSSVSLTAIDIQSKIFPESFPPNVEFLLHSIIGLPSHWTDIFALVNQRFLCGALTGPQWEVALGELHRVVAPGGWIQLVEGTTISGHMGPFSKKMGDLWSALFAHRGLLLDIADRLPDMVTRAGFVNIHREMRALPLGEWAGKDGVDFRDVLGSLISAMRGPIFEGGGFGVVKEEDLDDLVECLKKEWDEGREVYASKELMVMYAQKPFVV